MSAKKKGATVTPDELVAAALAYAAEGLRVHPLKPGTKVPMLDDWPELATTKAKLIKKWWRRWPNANVGIATGKASDLWVLDVDTGSHPDEARATLLDLVDKHGLDLAGIRRIVTPSGGVHYWYRYPKGEGVWTNKGGNRIRKNGGIDVRAEGGQVAAWPSVIKRDNKGKPYPGGPRQYADRGGERAKLPKWLAKMTRDPELAAIVSPTGTEVAKLDDLSRADRQRVAGYLDTATRAIADELEALKADPHALWDNEVFVRAQRLVDLANAPWSSLTHEAAHGILFAHAPRDKGFPDSRVQAKWDSAVKRATEVLPLPITPQAELTTFDFPADLKPYPEDYFHPKDGLLAEKLAKEVSADLGVGVDGKVWAYGGGVWSERDDEVHRRVIRHLGDRFRPSHAETVRAILTKGGYLPNLDTEPNPDFINVTNGMLDWRTGTLIEHDPALKSVVQLPVHYDENATCPRVDAWLAEVVPAEVLPLVWEVIGYLVMSGNPLHAAILLHGGGGNGKSTFIRLITALLGRWNVAAIPLRSMAEGKFEVAGLVGKIANLAGDIDAKYLSDTSRFKAITGGDEIEAQHKYGRPFYFTPWAVPLFSANELWRSADASEGYFRRWVTVPFPNKVEVGGKPFDEQWLIEETPGVLAKALPALRNLMSRKSFELIGAASELKRDFETTSDTVKLWLRDDEHIAQHDAGNTTLYSKRVRVYERYVMWCKDSGYAYPLQADRFYRRLEALGFNTRARKDHGTVRAILGIKLDEHVVTHPGGIPAPTYIDDEGAD